MFYGSTGSYSKTYGYHHPENMRSFIQEFWSNYDFYSAKYCSIFFKVLLNWNPKVKVSPIGKKKSIIKKDILQKDQRTPNTVLHYCLIWSKEFLTRETLINIQRNTLRNHAKYIIKQLNQT